MGEKKTGTIKAISPLGAGFVPEKTSVMIDGAWFNCDDNIKPSYVKKGPCEYEMTGELITFIKSTGSPTFGGGSKPGFTPGNKFVQDPERNMDIRSQMLVKAAIQALKVHNMIPKSDPKEYLKPTTQNLITTAQIIDQAVIGVKDYLKGGLKQNGNGSETGRNDGSISTQIV